MPSNAVHVVGQYTSAGILGLGGGSADLAFAAPCNEQTQNRFPGHINFDVKHYGGEGNKVFAMQIDAEEAQRLEDHRRELERRRPKAASGPATVEAVAGGKVAYYTYTKNCTETNGTRPTTSLAAVAHTSSTAIDIQVEGLMTAEAAKAVAGEILKKFAQAKFD